MMRYLKKVSLIVLIASITSTSLLACNKKDKATTDTAGMEVVTEENAKDLSNKIVLTVGDIEVSYKEILLYMQSYKEEYESLYGADIWSYTIDNDGGTFEQLFKEQLLEDIIYIKTICAQAEELKISLVEDELLNVDELTAEFLSSFTETQLKTYNIDIETVKKIYADNLLANKIYESLTLNVDTDVSDDEARKMVLEYILVANYTFDESGNRVEYTEDELVQARDRADNVRAQALDAESFYTFAQNNTDDEDEIRITVGKGDLSKELEAVAFSMREGDISDVIETKTGYFILHCVNAFDREATDTAKEDIISNRQEEAFSTNYAVWTSETKAKLNEDIWNEISFENVLFK